MNIEYEFFLIFRISERKCQIMTVQKPLQTWVEKKMKRKEIIILHNPQGY